MNCWITVYRTAWIALGILCMVAAASVFVPASRRLQVMQRKKTDLRDENLDFATKTRELRDKQQRFATSSDYVEYIARKMRMVKDDETVFVLTNTPSLTPPDAVP